MIVVDTSVWVAARRRPEGDVAETLAALLDEDSVALPLPVRLELLAGTAKHDRRAFRRALTALPVLHPSEETWRTLDDFVVRAADAGDRFGLSDLLIAALASEQGALVWSLDGDFERLARLGFAELY
jgi:predicted nucleic acid-binding protein